MSFKRIPLREMVIRVLADTLHTRMINCPDPYGRGRDCTVCNDICTGLLNRLIDLGWIEV